MTLGYAMICQTLAVTLHSEWIVGDPLPAPVFDARNRAKEHREAWEKSKGKFDTIEQGLVNTHADSTARRKAWEEATYDDRLKLRDQLPKGIAPAWQHVKDYWDV